MNLLDHFRGVKSGSQSLAEDGSHELPALGAGAEAKDDIGGTNPMFIKGKKKGGRATLAPAHALLHSSSSLNIDELGKQRETLTVGGSYETCIFHEEANSIIALPYNAGHSTGDSTPHAEQVVNRVVQVDCRKLRESDQSVQDSAAEFLPYPADDELLSAVDLSCTLSWSGACYSIRTKSIFALPSSDTGKVLRIDPVMQLQFIGDVMSDLGITGTNNSSAGKQIAATTPRARSMSRSISGLERDEAVHIVNNKQRLFSCACADPRTGFIFAVPFDADRILMILPEEQDGTTHAIGEEVSSLLEVPGAYVDAVYSELDGNIYLVPGNGARVLRINLSSMKASTWSTIPTPKVEPIGPRLRVPDPKFSCGAAINSAGYIYCVPDRAQNVYRIGPIVNKQVSTKIRVESLGGPKVSSDPDDPSREIQGRKYSAAVHCKTTNEIFCIPDKALRVLCVTAVRNSTGTRTGADVAIEVGVDLYDGPELEFCGAVIMDGNSSIYAVNHQGTEVLWIMPMQRVVERVPPNIGEAIDATILPPVYNAHKDHGNSFFAVFDHNPSYVKHFPSRLSQLTMHKLDQPWRKMKDIDNAWRDIHLLVTHGGSMGSQERVENAMYYDRLLDGLIKGVNQSIGGASFRYSFEQLFASLLNIDGANEFYTVENCWLAICPFLQALTRTKSIALLETLFELDSTATDDGSPTSKPNSTKTDTRKGSFSQRRGSRITGSNMKSVSSGRDVHDGVAACLLKALYDITEQLNLQETATPFEKVEFDALCKSVCEVLYATFSHRQEALRHELDELYPAKDKTVFSVLLRLDHLKDFLVLSGTCEFLATSQELHSQIITQVTDHNPTLNPATELYFEVLVSVVEKHTRRSKDLHKSDLLMPGSHLVSMFTDLMGSVDTHNAKTPSSTEERATITPTNFDITQAKRVFNMIDHDGDGHLDVAEIEALMTSMGIKFDSKAQLRKALDSLDLDGNGKVDFDEFSHWYHKNAPQDERFGFAKRFSRKNSLKKLGSKSEEEYYDLEDEDTEWRRAERVQAEDDESFSIIHHYNAPNLVHNVQMAVCNVFHVADHSRTESDDGRRRIRRAMFRALCSSQKAKVKKLVLVPATVYSTPVQISPSTDWGCAKWFHHVLTGGKHKDFTLLSEYFVLASGIAATWKDMKDRDEFEDAMSELAHSLAKMDNLILTSLLLLPKEERKLIAQTRLAEEMVTMSLSKPLALIMHTVDIISMGIFAPVYATLCYHAILEKKIPAQIYGKDEDVWDSTSLHYVFTALALFGVREGWKSAALTAKGMFHIYIADLYNIGDVLFVAGGVLLCSIVADPSSDCTLPRFRVLAAVVSGLLWLKILSIIRMLSVDFASFLIALGEIFGALESFMFVFCIFILAFGQMFVLLFEGDIYQARDDSVWVNWTEAYLALFRMMLGDFERDWFRTTKTDRDDDLIEEDGNSRLISLTATGL